MTKTMKIHTCAVWMSLAALLCGSFCRASDLPNIIFILSDDQAWWDYSFMYRPEVEKATIDMDPDIFQVAQTPAIDRLANEGLVFTSAYTQPQCRSSLASIVTGAFPHQTYITGNDLLDRAPDQELEDRLQVMNTLPRILVERLGYTAFQTGKWWEGHHSNGGFTQGDTVNSLDYSLRPSQWDGTTPRYAKRDRHGDFGLMIGRVDYVNDVAEPAYPIPYENTVQPATDFIDAQVANDQPFFLWYAPFLPHNPHDAPQALLNKYDALIDEQDEAGDSFAKYYANVERFDGGVGAILDHLDAKGIADNTLVIYVCDNGWIPRVEFSDLPAAKSKTTLYEGGTRTPIIVRWPARIRTGGDLEPQIVRTPVNVIDMVPTALAAVNLDQSPEMRGLNLMDLDAVEARTNLFAEDNGSEVQYIPDPSQSLENRLLVQDGWKLIMPVSAASELYHLRDTTTGLPVDPFETNDLASAMPAKVAAMESLIVDWYDEPKGLEWVAEQAQTSASAVITNTAEWGQTFTADSAQRVAAVRVGLKPLLSSQSITLELRELDGNGAPLGALLASSTLGSDQLALDETRWYLFNFGQPAMLSAATAYGLRLVSSAGVGGFEAAYKSPGPYSGGRCYFDGLIDGQDWTLADLDLAFEVLHVNYDDEARIELAMNGNELTLSGLMNVKGSPTILQSSTNLTAWSDETEDANRDGLSVWNTPRDQDREFFRVALKAAGDVLDVVPDFTGAVYIESFDGSGANLNGTEPGTTTGSATWTAPAGGVFFDDGSLAAQDASASLPFSPQNGFVYTLSVEMVQDSDWIAFGFMKNPPTTNKLTTDGILWALTRNASGSDNQVLHENASGGTGAVAPGNYVTGAATVSMSLVLDTTGGTGNWNYDWIVDGVARVTDRPLSASFESAIGGVAIGNHSAPAGCEFRSFNLTQE